MSLMFNRSNSELHYSRVARIYSVQDSIPLVLHCRSIADRAEKDPITLEIK